MADRNRVLRGSPLRPQETRHSGISITAKDIKNFPEISTSANDGNPGRFDKPGIPSIKDIKGTGSFGIAAGKKPKKYWRSGARSLLDSRCLYRSQPLPIAFSYGK